MADIKPVAWVSVADTQDGLYSFHGIEYLPAGRHELYTAAQLEQARCEAIESEELNPWKVAIINGLIIDFSINDENAKDATLALRTLLAAEAEPLLNPDISQQAGELIEKAKREEREACAKICEDNRDHYGLHGHDSASRGANSCLNAIRARNEKGES